MSRDLDEMYERPDGFTDEEWEAIKADIEAAWHGMPRIHLDDLTRDRVARHWPPKPPTA